MKRFFLIGLLSAFSITAHAQTVTKLVDTFDSVNWQKSPWNSASGALDFVADPSGDGQIMKIEAHFSGSGFKWYAIDPIQPIWIPGETKQVSLRFKRNNNDYGMLLTFIDGWGRSQNGDAKLEWSLPFGEKDQWVTATFDIPQGWVQPIRIGGFNVNNWFHQDVNGHPAFWVDDLKVVTDLSNIDEQGRLTTWTPQPNPEKPENAFKESPKVELLTTDFSSGVKSNVFAGEKPQAILRAMNWSATPLTATLSYRILDNDGTPVLEKQMDVVVDGTSNTVLPLEVEKFGRYTLESQLKLSNGDAQKQEMTFAYLPPIRELTRQQKMDSPYGINVHSGTGLPLADVFRKAGLIWYRDYAFGYDWLVRAKGEDKKYAGWPNYPAIMKVYEDTGTIVMPCLQKGLFPPEMKDEKVVGKLGPKDEQWAAELVDMVNAFPQVTHWELANEYDLHKENIVPEELVGWKNYGLYHQAFAETLAKAGNGKLVAVENGRAGIWPDAEREMIEGGYFDLIGVINSHHYCGVDAPETNFGNFNTGFDDGSRAEKPMLFFDRLRDTARVADIDGKDRQSWLTEFGWDTLAVKIVSPYQQAVYLPRGWMVALAAGTEKSFWYWDYDSPKPTTFFDGCGLLSPRPKAEPKLALCALAGLTSVLPNPVYVGSMNAGPGTQGYVFEQDGKLVASLWNISDDNGPMVTLPAEKLYDYLGNPLEGKTVQLTMAPVYAVGMDEDSIGYRQTAYSLYSHYLIVGTAGDPNTAVLQIENNRDKAIQCEITIQLPESWTAEQPQVQATVQAGETQQINWTFNIDPDESLGEKEVTFLVSEEDGLVKAIPLRVLVQRPLVMEVTSMTGRPGRETQVDIKIGNKSELPVTGILTTALPKSWKASESDMPISLQPGENKTIPFKFQWSDEITPGEEALVTFKTDKASVSQPIIPNTWHMPLAKDLKMDGDLSDWPAEALIPAWMTGCTMGEPNAEMYFAWSPEGIYGAVKVLDSKVLRHDPRGFWAGDAVEIYLDAADNKNHREANKRTLCEFHEGDHHFWAVPIPEENRAYLGQWKSWEEIPQTIFDIPNVQSGAKTIDGGYVMEFLIPAAMIKNYQPETGKIGFNANIVVKGQRFEREVYWFRPKNWATNNWPMMWGTMVLEK